jgi:hypothetical protein
MKWGKWFIVAIMVIFNVYYVLTSNGILLHESIRITIFLFIGTSAPVVAFLTGEIWAIDKIKHTAKMRREDETYQAALNEWETGLINSWNSQKKKWGGQVNIQVHSPEYSLSGNGSKNILPTVSDSTRQSNSMQTLSKKVAMKLILDNESEYKDTIQTVLDSNPKANQRDIAEAIAIAMTGESTGYKTVIRAYQELEKDLL